MNVFLTGGTGFVGSEILKQLLDSGHTVRCLVRAGSESKLPPRPGVEVTLGDATDAGSLQGAMQGCDAVIHLIGIIREVPSKQITFERLHVEATRNVVEAARSQGVKRYLHMSANGSRADGDCDYHRTKWRAEEVVRQSELDWTVFRPSLIIGAKGEFVSMIAGQIRTLPILPVIGDGRYCMSPVAVQDVARGFVLALEKPETIGQAYHCCGPQSHTFDELLDIFAKVLGKVPRTKVHQPLWLMKPAVALLESLPSFPITTSQMTMLLEGNVCDPADWSSTFGITPKSLEEQLKAIFG